MSKVTEHDAITNKTIVRDMTDNEKAQLALDLVELQAQTDAQAAKIASRQEVLDKLGLTANEAAALFG